MPPTQRVRMDVRRRYRSVADELADLPALVPARIASRMLAIHERTLRRRAARGLLRIVKPDKSRCGLCYVPRDELRRLLLGE